MSAAGAALPVLAAVLGAGVLPLTTGDGTELDAYDVTPGLLGFAVTFAVVVAAILIMLNMTGKLRRLNHRAELEEQERRLAAQPGAGTGGAEAPADGARSSAADPAGAPDDGRREPPGRTPDGA